MKEKIFLETDEQIKAFTHPYRLKVLQALRDSAGPATATDIARTLGDGPGRVHYHVKILEQAGLIQLVDTLMINGILARRYEPAAKQYVVKPEAIQVDQKQDFYKIISKRFREGLRQFLDSSFETKPESHSARPRSFLFEFKLFCTDEEWLELQRQLVSANEQYSRQEPGRTLRRLFIAGATENAASEDAQKVEQESSDESIVWTFGFAKRDTVLRGKPLIPHDE
jgi:DNA-binding transcriptional ArsR family regulator